MRNRGFAVGLGVALFAMASANGSMSMALGNFRFRDWCVYVVITVVFEAVALGRWLKIPLMRALWASIIANFITAIIGLPFHGMGGYLFGGLVGSRYDPNPFLSTILLFIVFGLVSALIESLVWKSFWRRWSTVTRSVVKATVVVHLIGVPLGLAILLMPEYPYPGLTGRVWFLRDMAQMDVRRSLNDYIAGNHRLPDVQSYEELVLMFRDGERLRYLPDPSVLAWMPRYQRFDMKDEHRGPHWEWNRAVSGRTVSEEPMPPVWLARVDYGDGHYRGLVFEDHEVRLKYKPQDLGFAPKGAQ